MAQSDLFRDLHNADGKRGGNVPVEGDAGRDEDAASESRQRLSAEQRAVLVIPGAVFVLSGALLAIAVLTVVGGEFALGRLLGAVPAVGAAFLAVRGKRLRSLGLCCAALGVLVVWAMVFVALL